MSKHSTLVVRWKERFINTCQGRPRVDDGDVGKGSEGEDNDLEQKERKEKRNANNMNSDLLDFMKVYAHDPFFRFFFSDREPL